MVAMNAQSRGEEGKERGARAGWCEGGSPEEEIGDTSEFS